MVDQQGFQGLAEVLDQMKPIDHLHRLGCPPANAVGIEVTPIAADDGDRRMLGQPGRHGRGRAVRQQVHDAMRLEIDQDGAIPMAPPPGPLVHPNGLQGWGVGRTGAARTRRRRVDALVGSRRRAASRAPAFPPRAMPIARRVVISRVVLRAYGATSAGRRSVKMRRAQRAFRQTNFRTISWIRTASAPQGRSVRWR